MNPTTSPVPTSSRFSEVRIPCGDAWLEGDLTVPYGARGIVVFAHGSGSSRRSSRNRFVAEQINDLGLATLLFDLLTPGEAKAEEHTGELRFNIPFLAGRLRDATRWIREEPSLGGLKIGYFGSSTGAAAALAAATDDPTIAAVVSRGGRTDLAGTEVENVRASTLLIVGGLDYPVISWNKETYRRLSCEKRISIVEGASHLFEEPGKLEEVAELAASWFKLHLNPPVAMKTTDIFHDRADAGRQLAGILPVSLKQRDPIILALPRGGVPVAAEIARAWGVPFDVLVVRKIGVPGSEEFAMGAIASGGVKVLDQELIAKLGLSGDQVEAVVGREIKELQRRENLYRGDRPTRDLTGRTVILVDDGIATGSTMMAAIGLLRRQGAGRIVVAAPVAAPDTAARLREAADEVFIVIEPEYFRAVGRWYEDFSETSDEQVRSLLGA